MTAEEYAASLLLNSESYADTLLNNKADRLAVKGHSKSNRLGLDTTTSAAQLQQRLSDTIDSRIYTRDDGSKYTVNYQPSFDEYGYETVTPVENEFIPTTNKYGNTDNIRNLYIDDTAEGDYKLGLAASGKGFIGRYTPGDDGYGWAPGPKGVTVEDGALLDIELPKSLATQFEYDVHRNAGQIANRSIGQGPITQEDIASYGSGKTEYTTPNAPMWNINSTYDNLQGDTPLPKNPYDKRATPTNVDGTPIAAPAEPNEGRIGEDIDMAQGAVAKFGADTLNMFKNVVGKENIAKYNAWAGELEKKLGGDGEAGWFLTEEDVKEIDNMRDLQTAQKEFGVSEETLKDHSKAMKESEHMWVNAETTADYLKSLVVGMSQLDRILAGSAGEIGGLMIPGGPALVAATRTSNFAEEYETNNDKPMDKTKLAQTFFTELALLVPEKLLIKSGVGDIVSKTAGKGGILGRLTIAGTGEGLQEYGEGISEEVATQKEGARTVGEIATDPKTVHQAAIGFGMGTGTKGAGETVAAVAKPLKSRAEELATDLKAQAVKAKAAVGGVTNTVKAVRKAVPQASEEIIDSTITAIKEAAVSTQDGTVDGDAAGATNIDPDVYVAVMDSEDTASNGVKQVDLIEDSEEVNKLAEDFDNTYSAGISQIKEMIAEMKEGIASGQADSQAYANSVREGLAGGIVALQEKIDAMVAAGAGPNKMNAANAKVEAIIPMINAIDVDAMAEVINKPTVDTASKVSLVLGSSKASTEDIETVLGTEGITEAEKAMLEFKLKTLKAEGANKYTVHTQKIIGGGAKPGVIQWASMLKEGATAANKIAIDNIQAFADSQSDKLNKLEEALNQWDTDRGMPWTDSENKVEFKETKEYKENGFTDNVKAQIRNANIGNDAKINVPGWNEGSVHSIGDIITTIKGEQTQIEELLTNAKAVAEGSSKKASPEAQKQAQEPQKEPEQPTSPVEDKKTPKTAEEPLATQAELDNATAEIDATIEKVKEAKARSINKAKRLAKFAERGAADGAKLTPRAIEDNYRNLQANAGKEAADAYKAEADKVYNAKVEEAAKRRADRQTPKVSKVTIAGNIIEFTSIPKDPKKPLAAFTKDGIYLQEGLTSKEVADYLLQEEAVTPKMQGIINTKKIVTNTLNAKYDIDFVELLKGLDAKTVRKFLLLHEHRHGVQAGKRATREEFVADYKLDPVKFEVDANEFALKSLGLIDDAIVIETPTVKDTNSEIKSLEEQALSLLDGLPNAFNMSVKETKDAPLICKGN